MLTFNLKKKWFAKIKSGEKTHEYREVKPYWTKRLCNELLVKEDELNGYKAYCNHVINFVRGYSNLADDRLLAILTSIRVVNGKYTDLGIDKPVYAIEFEVLPLNKKKSVVVGISYLHQSVSSMSRVNSLCLCSR